MTTLTIIKLLLSLVNTLIGFARDRNLIAAGEANATAKSLAEAMEKIDRARRARDSVTDSGMHDDPDKRD